MDFGQVVITGLLIIAGITFRGFFHPLPSDSEEVRKGKDLFREVGTSMWVLLLVYTIWAVA